MIIKEQAQKIKNYWEEQALKYGSSYLATIPDKFLKEMEVTNILKYFPSKSKKIKVLDVGCGNGFSTLRYADACKKAKIIGVDYSEEMIHQAKIAKAKQKNLSNQDIQFFTSDVLNLGVCDEEFDIVTTDRCLINLVSLEHQKKALREIHRVLKKNAKYIMCEDTQEGLAKINSMRSLANLSIIKNHWHNLYLNEKKLLPYLKRYFRIITIDNFSSTYYIGSRIFNALSAENPEKPNYLSQINKIAAEMQPLGDYSPLKIVFLEKK